MTGVAVGAAVPEVVAVAAEVGPSVLVGAGVVGVRVGVLVGVGVRVRVDVEVSTGASVSVPGGVNEAA